MCVQKAIHSKTMAEGMAWTHRACDYGLTAFQQLHVCAQILFLSGKDLAGSKIFELQYEYPNVPSALFLSGMDALQRGKLDEALGYMQHALSNDPDYVEAARAVALILQLSELPEKPEGGSRE